MIVLRIVSSGRQSRPLTGFPSNHCSGMASPRNEVIWGVKTAPLQHRHSADHVAGARSVRAVLCAINMPTSCCGNRQRSAAGTSNDARSPTSSQAKTKIKTQAAAVSKKIVPDTSKPERLDAQPVQDPKTLTMCTRVSAVSNVYAVDRCCCSCDCNSYVFARDCADSAGSSTALTSLHAAQQAQHEALPCSTD